MLLLVLLVHFFLHFPETLFDRPGGFVHRYDQLKDELVQEPDQQGIQNIFHTVKIIRAGGPPPVFGYGLPKS